MLKFGRIKFFLKKHSLLYRKIYWLRKNLKVKNNTNHEIAPVVGDKNVPRINDANASEMKCNFHGVATVYKIDQTKEIEDNFSLAYELHLREMIRLCKKAKVKYMVVTQPSLYHYKDLYDPLVQTNSVIEDDALLFQDWRRTIQVLYPKLIEIAGKVAAKEGSPYYDFSNIFGPMDDVGKYYTDDVHQTFLGKQIIADKIKALLEQNNFLS